MTYRAKPVTQRDGSALQFSNCLMATAAVGLDYHTLGEKTSSGTTMRRLSGDLAGGTNSDEVVRAWKRGYDEDAVMRDGHPWSKVIEDLKEGRLVMLQWWAATVGEVCISGTGAYGHGVAVAPESREQSGVTQWLVADPWCKPPRWAWVDEDDMRRGAERWARQMGAGGRDFGIEPPGPGEEPSQAWVNFTYAFADYYMDPEHQSDVPPSEGPGAGGSQGVLFASTKPHAEEGDDMSINTNGSDIESKRRVKLTADAGFYADAALTKKYGTLSKGSERVFIGPAVGANSHAILVKTSKPYSDGTDRPTICYVTKDKCGEPYTIAEPPIDHTERDKQWRAWLNGDADAPDK